MDDFKLIEFFPGLILAKDIHSTVLNASQGLAKMVGWKHGKFIGKKDHDIPCKASEFAGQFVLLDQKVIIAKQNMLTLDIQQYDEGWTTLLVERKPMIDQSGSCVGIISQAIDLSTSYISKSLCGICLSDNKKIMSYRKPAIYMLSEAHLPIALSKRQQECLFLLIRGKSIKEMARILEISTRTVEEHLDAIKAKLNCRTKNQIIEKAIDLGFLYYIPQKFIDNSPNLLG